MPEDGERIFSTKNAVEPSSTSSIYISLASPKRLSRSSMGKSSNDKFPDLNRENTAPSFGNQIDDIQLTKGTDSASIALSDGSSITFDLNKIAETIKVNAPEGVGAKHTLAYHFWERIEKSERGFPFMRGKKLIIEFDDESDIKFDFGDLLSASP